MGNRAVRAQATNRNGDQVTLQTHETDAPILPVAQLEQLHQFRPDLVDFVIAQTRIEAETRRSIDNRTNWFIFIERIVGQLSAIIVALLGIGGGIYAGIHGQPWLGGTIASVTIGTLSVAFLRRNQPSPPKPQTKK